MGSARTHHRTTMNNTSENLGPVSGLNLRRIPILCCVCAIAVVSGCSYRSPSSLWHAQADYNSFRAPSIQVERLNRRHAARSRKVLEYRSMYNNWPEGADEAEFASLPSRSQSSMADNPDILPLREPNAIVAPIPRREPIPSVAPVPENDPAPQIDPSKLQQTQAVVAASTSVEKSLHDDSGVDDTAKSQPSGIRGLFGWLNRRGKKQTSSDAAAATTAPAAKPTPSIQTARPEPNRTLREIPADTLADRPNASRDVNSSSLPASSNSMANREPQTTGFEPTWKFGSESMQSSSRNDDEDFKIREAIPERSTTIWSLDDQAGPPPSTELSNRPHASPVQTRQKTPVWSLDVNKEHASSRTDKSEELGTKPQQQAWWGSPSSNSNNAAQPKPKQPIAPQPGSSASIVPTGGWLEIQ